MGGVGVRDVALDSLGRRIGMVLQEPFLFTGTIEENIRYNTTGATLDDVVAAAKAVSAHDFIMRAAGGLRHQAGSAGAQHLGGPAPARVVRPPPWWRTRRS